MRIPPREVRPQPHTHNRCRSEYQIPGDVITKTASLDLFKLLINSVLSRKGAKVGMFDIKNFYLQTPLDLPEDVRIKLDNTPQDFIDEYSLHDYVYVNGWVYFEIHNVVYGLPQSGALTNALLEKRLKAHG